MACPLCMAARELEWHLRRGGTAADRDARPMRQPYLLFLYFIEKATVGFVCPSQWDSDTQGADYCCWMPAASRTLFQRASSPSMNLPKASGVEPLMTTPALVSRSRTASSLRMSLIVLLSLATTAGGVPLGTKKPYQV